jgi:uncharacterized membrane protein
VSNVGATASEEQISVEVVRTVVGVIGVLAAVPFTTAIAAYAVVPRRTSRAPSIV